MADVFTIANEFDLDSNGDLVPATTAIMVNLFTQYNEIDLETIKQNLVYYWEFGYHVENLKWSHGKLLNSCKATLHQKVKEHLYKLESLIQTGPVTFYFMMTEIMASTEVSLRVVITKLKKLCLKDIDGRNISKVASCIWGAILYLCNYWSQPSNTIYLILPTLQACSSDNFKKFIATIYTNHCTKVNCVSVDDFLDLAESK